MIYNLGEEIGKGGFAKVFRVTPINKQDFQMDYYAAKVYTKSFLLQKGEMKKFYVKKYRS